VTIAKTKGENDPSKSNVLERGFDKVLPVRATCHGNHYLGMPISGGNRTNYPHSIFIEETGQRIFSSSFKARVEAEIWVATGTQRSWGVAEGGRVAVGCLMPSADPHETIRAVLYSLAAASVLPCLRISLSFLGRYDWELRLG